MFLSLLSVRLSALTSFFFFSFFFKIFFFFFYPFHLNLVSENCHLLSQQVPVPDFWCLGLGVAAGPAWDGAHPSVLVPIPYPCSSWSCLNVARVTQPRVNGGAVVEGELYSLEHHEKSCASDRKHVSIPSSHPWVRKEHVCVSLHRQEPHPSPGILFLAFLGTSSLSWYPSSCILRDFIPLLVSFSWHSQGLHPSLGISRGCILS